MGYTWVYRTTISPMFDHLPHLSTRASRATFTMRVMRTSRRASVNRHETAKELSQIF